MRPKRKEATQYYLLDIVFAVADVAVDWRRSFEQKYAREIVN